MRQNTSTGPGPFGLPVTTLPPVVDMTANGRDGLLVALSDLHIGGDAGQEDFFCHGELTALLGDLDAEPGPVTLLVNGDFFEFLQVSVPPGGNRAQAIIEHSDHADFFVCLRQWNARAHHRTVYVVGNHDSETGWNAAIGEYLIAEGIVHAIALGYEHIFTATDGTPITVYAEHGNEEDDQNAIVDYGHPLVAPIGTHVVTQIVNRVEPLGQFSGPNDATTLSDIDNIYPLEMVPWWLLGSYFYRQVRRFTKFVLLPAAVILLAARFLNGIVIWLTFDRFDELSLYAFLRVIGFLFLDVIVVLGLVLFVLWRDFARWRRRTNLHEPVQIAVTNAEHYRDACRAFLTGTRRPTHRADGAAPLDVFLYGHNHIAELQGYDADGRPTAFGNTGTWMRKLVRVATRFKLPPVFIPVYDLTYITARMTSAGLALTLARRVKPLPYHLAWPERFATFRTRPRVSPPSEMGREQIITTFVLPAGHAISTRDHPVPAYAETR